MFTNQKSKLFAVVCCLCLLAASVRAQVTFSGYTIYDYLVSATHPNACTSAYVTGLPDDSIWVNFADGQVATGNFCSTWHDGPGDELLLETGYHQSNYTVRLKLSNGSHSAPHAVAVMQWTQIPDAPWRYIHVSCWQDSFASGRYIIPLDFAADFGLTTTDVVTGIEITFLATSGQADLAGVYIIANHNATQNTSTDTTVCQGQSLILDATTPGVTYRWQDNSANPTFNVTQQGTYWVEITNSCGSTTTDTFHVTADPLPSADLGNDATLCPSATLPLNVSQPNATYLWQNNSTNATFNVTQQGSYWVQVTNQCGSTRDTIIVAYASLPVVDLGNDTTLCPSATLPLNVSQPNATYLWQNNSTNATFNITQAGSYWAQVTNQCGSARDTIIVAYATLPTVDLGNDTTLCPSATLPLNVSQPNATYLWQNNSNNATFNVTQAGSYWVQVTNQCGNARDTILVAYATLPTVNLGDDTILCPTATLPLNVTQPNATYLWQDNSTNAAFNVTQPGSYWVRVTKQCGTATDTITVTYATLPTVNLGNDTTLCPGATLPLNASQPNATYSWQDNSTNATFDVTQQGAYWVQVTDQCGSATDTINVAYAALPAADLGNDTTLCSGAALLLDVSQPDAAYLWRNNSTAATFNVTQQGAHWVQVSNLCGSATDTINVTYTSAPTVNLGDDTTLCDGETLMLEVFFADADYLWQDNSSNMMFTVSQPGMYWVQGVNQCGSVTDSIIVTYNPLPEVNLGRDTTLCTGARLRLNAALPDATYLWQDNSTDSTFQVTEPGIYWVQVSGCGTASDTLIVSPDELCGCPLFLPNAFSPNGDGLHDVLKASCECEMTTYHFVLFNRWGERMFETRDINDSWNGIYKGKRVPTEVYVYFVEYSFGNTSLMKKGNVTVVR